MVNYSKFFGFSEVLGIAFLTTLSVFLAVTLQPAGLFVILLAFLDMMMICHFVAKIVGIATSSRVVVVK